MESSRPPKSDALREAARWLRYARDDAQTARSLLSVAGAPPRHSAWHAQQAAEKALKAVLVAEERPFPFTHNLAYLLSLVPPRWRVHDARPDWAALTRHASEARYPDDLPDVNDEDALTAVADAERVVEAVSADLAPLLGDEG